jgi:hypothetical protein
MSRSTGLSNRLSKSPKCASRKHQRQGSSLLITKRLVEPQPRRLSRVRLLDIRPARSQPHSWSPLPGCAQSRAVVTTLPEVLTSSSDQPQVDEAARSKPTAVSSTTPVGRHGEPVSGSVDVALATRHRQPMSLNRRHWPKLRAEVSQPRGSAQLRGPEKAKLLRLFFMITPRSSGQSHL